MSKIFPGDIAEDFNKLYETKEGYDTIIIAGEEPNVEEIHAHSLILRTRSSYFRSALSVEWEKRTNNGYLVLKKPNINPLTIKIILKFLYCEIVDLKNQDDKIILELLAAADELLIQKLTDFVQEFLIQNSYKFLQRGPINVLHSISHLEKFNELKDVFLEIICGNPSLLFDSDEFFSLEEDALKLIIKCDNLAMKESVIWKQLIRWGTARRTLLESNVMDEDTMDEDEDGDTLEKILHELIKFIRFHQIDRMQFMNEVWPFKDLLPINLIENILRYYLEGAIPSYNVFLIRWGNFEIDSVLINKEIALLFTKWIDKKTINDMNSKGFQYNFNLLYRSSSDGLSTQNFHRKCDNKGATIVVAKIQDSGQLVGGYNPTDWKGDDEYRGTADSFLFLLNPNNIKRAMISRISHDYINYAIYCDKSFGPCFGEADLEVTKNKESMWNFKEKSYSKMEISGLHLISDYEVFQIVSVTDSDAD